jgi:hypothetical protein
MKKLTDKERAKEIDRGIRLVWESLESHLEYTHEKHVDGDFNHHRQCIKDYAELMVILSKLY